IGLEDARQLVARLQYPPPDGAGTAIWPSRVIRGANAKTLPRLEPRRRPWASRPSRFPADGAPSRRREATSPASLVASKQVSTASK
ncbi:hypothetical protein K4A07_19625, partial [Lactiplantibacillus plantarum]|nr:hypothetical protein [Lactiplantibacillus plantarum]